jgi:hypothetical protein
MIYKIPNLKIQKISNKGNMTKKLDLTHNLQKLITVATPLWPSVRMKLTLPKLGIWSPPGLPNF